MFSLESPHLGDSNEYTQYTIFYIIKSITRNYPKSTNMRFCPKGIKKEFETAVVNEPSVFEPLKFYCIKSQNVVLFVKEMAENILVYPFTFRLALLIPNPV